MSTNEHVVFGIRNKWEIKYQDIISSYKYHININDAQQLNGQTNKNILNPTVNQQIWMGKIIIICEMLFLKQ